MYLGRTERKMVQQHNDHQRKKTERGKQRECMGNLTKLDGENEH